jgi:CP family cyanate transporter-like MFS transporter
VGLFALFLGGLATRPQMMVVGPLIPLIQEDLAVPHAVAGLLATIPLVCMGIFALAGPTTAQIFGTRWGMTLSLIAMAVFGLARAVAPNALLVLLATIPIGIGIGIGGALLPIAVKERFSKRPAFATGMYTNGYQAGAAVSAAVAAPLALWLGGWRESLALVSIASLAFAVVWHVTTRDNPHEAPRMAASRPHWPLRDKVAWMLVVSFALRAGIFQALLSWLPAVYVERGWSITAAGLLPVAMTLGGIPATLAVTRIADVRGSRRLYMAMACSMLTVACLLLVIVPDIGYLGAALCGACLGTLFPIALTLPLDLAERPQDVGALASMMLAGGFGVSAVAPFLLGAARDLTGDFTGSLLLLAFFSVLLLVTTLVMSPERLAARRAAASRA